MYLCFQDTNTKLYLTASRGGTDSTINGMYRVSLLQKTEPVKFKTKELPPLLIMAPVSTKESLSTAKLFV